MEEFLSDLGLITVKKTSDILFMRGTGGENHVHITERGDPALVGFAIHARSLEDLKEVSKQPGASAIEKIDEPGGGSRVRIKEPNGYTIEVVHGIEKREPISTDAQLQNTVAEPLNRTGELRRIPLGPSKIHRIGHVVLCSPEPQKTAEWFRKMFGFVASDDIYIEEESNLLASFNRLDGGENYVDHHALAFLAGETAGLQHVSFEVQNIDDVFAGHDHMVSKQKYEHMWGIGRHLLGSQVFDYWADPWGRVHENWADTDKLNNSAKAKSWSAEEGFISQWGEHPPEKFVTRVSP
jgi:hypothetical protein